MCAHDWYHAVCSLGLDRGFISRNFFQGGACHSQEGLPLSPSISPIPIPLEVGSPPLPLEVKVKVALLTSVGFRSLSRFFAVSLQVTRVIDPAVGCHYFSPGPQLPWQPLRGLLPISLLGEQRHDGSEQFA